MLYRTMGRTGLSVSLAGLGTGGPSQLGQSAGLAEAESHRLVRTALDLGINLFDTSPAYRQSEILLGGGLKGVDPDRYVLATKFPPTRDGKLREPGDLTASVEKSLRRLGVETIDVLQYHGVSLEEYGEVIDRFHGEAQRAQEAGKIRFIGITEAGEQDPEHAMLLRALHDDLFDTFMVKYGILNQSAEAEVLPLAAEQNVGVFVMASVRRSLRTPQEAVSRLNAFIDEGLLAIPRPKAEDPLGLGTLDQPAPGVTRAAYQFAAAHPAVSTLLVGTGNVDHLRTNVADILAPGLSPEQMSFLRETYGRLTWTA
jgi:aryl-alcohol dehydrogenase-like predicted oxidoreductase